MSTFIVLGAGLAAENFIYFLGKSDSSIHSVIQLSSDAFYPACSLRSTAIVASRGVSTGHSELGDLLVASYERFKTHVLEDSPAGIYQGIQWTGAGIKISEFTKRHPDAQEQDSIKELDLKFSKKLYVTSEPCFIIDPEIYLKWLRDQSKIKIERHEEVITEIKFSQGEWEVGTSSGKTYRATYLFSGLGNYHRFWKENYPVTSGIQSSKPVQGSYLVYSGVDLGERPFSLTMDGNNFIYHPWTKKMIIGSTTINCSHLLPDEKGLQTIDQNLRELFPEWSWPAFSEGQILTGLREKAQGRRPYLEIHENAVLSGGYYKNGYSLGPYLAEKAISLFSQTKLIGK